MNLPHPQSNTRFFVTGAAGFIGGHLTRALLDQGHTVVGVDNFLASSRDNFRALQGALSPDARARFHFVEGDLRDADLCMNLMEGVDVVLHHAALASVPRSVDEPLASHAHNVTTMVNLLEASRHQRPKAFVYASSSAVYGDDPALPKCESQRGEALSPYAAAKQMLEDYAALFHRCYDLSVVGLRYFNVFGPHQTEGGPYAAVIPAWAGAFASQRPAVLYGDGSSTRDFVSVHDVVRANLLAARFASSSPVCAVYNIGTGVRTSLLGLYEAMATCWGEVSCPPTFLPERPGDIPHSVADISLAQRDLGYAPQTDLKEALGETLSWYKGR
ncbi:MAG: NAD-dependent epimerase/dehydratase family protein [Proteobacteria bacterium]|nr:NAD-dependent epimerase/dehydratase family protein [Pseudomonadota bacterium]